MKSHFDLMICLTQSNLRTYDFNFLIHYSLLDCNFFYQDQECDMDRDHIQNVPMI